jgi:hypothetical protein
VKWLLPCFGPCRYGIPKLANTTRPYNISDKLDCKRPEYASILSGKQLSTPRRVVWAFHFSAETHVLTLRFNMYKDIVDVYVVMEGTLSESQCVLAFGNVCAQAHGQCDAHAALRIAASLAMGLFAMDARMACCRPSVLGPEAIAV